jgi:hypothetical protein
MPGPRRYPFLHLCEPVLLPSPSSPGRPPYNLMASPLVPVHASAKAMMVSSNNDIEMGLQQFTKVLASLGYNEMVSPVTLLTYSSSAARWIRSHIPGYNEMASATPSLIHRMSRCGPGPSPPLRRPTSSSRPPDPDARIIAYSLSTSLWATSLSQHHRRVRADRSPPHQLVHERYRDLISRALQGDLKLVFQIYSLTSCVNALATLLVIVNLVWLRVKK